jgi:hypothetical protein
VCQYDGFWEPDFRSAERLTDTVGLADRVRIDQRHLQSARMAECQHSLVEVGEPETMALPLPAAADHPDANRPFQQLRI